MTDFDLMQQLAAQRRNQFAQQAQFQAPQGQMVGGHFVAPNILQQLAAGLRSIGGMRGQQLAEQELQDISRQRTEGNEKAMAEFLRLAKGTPENAPGDGMGPVMPAQPQNMTGAFAALRQAPDMAMRQAGMQGAISTAQQQAQQAQQQEAQRRKFQALQTLGPAEAVRQGIVTFQEAEGFVNADNLGLPIVARTAEILGPNGEKLIQAFDQRNQPVGPPIPAYMAPVQVNRGDRIEFVSPTPGQTFTVGMSPAERDAAARGWATFQQGERRLATEGAPKAPPGYRFTSSNSLEAIPGGPADIKAGEAGDRRRKTTEAATAQANRVIAKVDQAMAQVSPVSAGLGSLTASIPTTPARDLQATLDTIKANLGFAELQAMRDASPTGGALGAIAVQELVALQATVASLDQGQRPEVLRQRLQEVRRHYENWKDVMRRNQELQQGTSPRIPDAQTKPAPFVPEMPSGFRIVP